MSIAGVDIRQLRAFVMVGEELNFLRAASRLCVSQPALSQTIRMLEGQLGITLFSRNTRSVALTEVGAALLPKAQAILDNLEDLALTASSHLNGIRGTLKVGFLIGAGVDLMPRILSTFARRYPQVKVVVSEFDFANPQSGMTQGMDVAILRPPLELADIELITLVEEDCVACLPSSHRLAGESSVSIYDLLDEPIIAAPGSGAWRSYWTGNEYRHGRPAPVVHEASTVESELQAVASERGISITAASTARFYARPGLSFPVIEDMPPCKVCVALPAEATGAARNFAQLAVEVAAGQ